MTSELDSASVAAVPAAFLAAVPAAVSAATPAECTLVAECVPIASVITFREKAEKDKERHRKHITQLEVLAHKALSKAFSCNSNTNNYYVDDSTPHFDDRDECHRLIEEIKGDIEDIEENVKLVDEIDARITELLMIKCAFMALCDDRSGPSDILTQAMLARVAKCNEEIKTLEDKATEIGIPKFVTKVDLMFRNILAARHNPEASASAVKSILTIGTQHGSEAEKIANKEAEAINCRITYESACEGAYGGAKSALLQ